MPGDDDLDFFEQMQAHGVKSYGQAPPAKARPAPPPPPSVPVIAPPPASPKPPPPPAPDPRDLEIARLRAELAEALARSTTLLAERDGVDRKRRSVQEELEKATANLATLTGSTPLLDVLRDRGSMSQAEDVELLVALLAERPEELFVALDLFDGAAVATLLEERVVFVCGRAECAPKGPVATVRVPPGRCEVCGGSDIRAAFGRFEEACLANDVRSVVIVGGSPAYRRQLRDLQEATGSALRLDLVSGTTRRPKRKAEADMRRADVVAIWGATILDHSISENYVGGSARLLRVPERGITRMLDAVRRDVLAAARGAG